MIPTETVDTETGEIISEPKAVAVIPASANILPSSIAIEDLTRHVDIIEQVANKVMKQGVHFGLIPGTKKPTLYKAGAEVLRLTFNLRAVMEEKDVQRVDHEGGHREFIVRCHIITPSGMEIAIGVGSCSTLEAKYRWRNGERVCPQCGKPTIIKGKDEYGGGWLCWKKNGGCGTKWDNGAAAIEDQEVGKVENTNIADCYNTVLKMAKTRAFRDGMLMATATSGRFTQDLEDPHADEEGHYEEEDHGGGRARQEQPRQERKAAPAPNVRPQEFARAAQRQTEAKVTNMRGGALPVEDEAALSASGEEPNFAEEEKKASAPKPPAAVVETAKALLAELEAFAKKRAFGETVEDLVGRILVGRGITKGAEAAFVGHIRKLAGEEMPQKGLQAPAWYATQLANIRKYAQSWTDEQKRQS
jgi:hypothetical protein